MAKAGNYKMDELIKEMSHYDPDNMEMAAKRLSEIILAGQINLEADPKIAQTVQEAFMKQIESENDTVQSEAIKYLADIVPSLPSDQVQLIFEKILQYITTLDLPEKKRERYGACAATVIHQASVQFGHKLSNLFLKSIKKLLEFKDKKTEIEIVLINIITEFLKKWPTEAMHLPYDRRNLVVYLLKNVQVKTKLEIIKKSEHCIGKLSVIVDKDVLDTMLNDKDWGLLRVLHNNKAKSSLESLKQLRNGLLCLSQIVRTHNVELRHWIKASSLLLVDIVNQFKETEDIDNIEIICDIIDAALTTLSYIFKAFSRELRELLEPRDNPFNHFVQRLLVFDVEGMMNYAGEAMEIEEQYQEDQEYYEETEVDEKCWKVRRSTLFYLSFLAKYDKHFLQRIGEGELLEDLGNKLIEEHSLVSEMAFLTFNTLIDLISVDRSLNTDEIQLQQMGLQRVKSSALTIADHLIKQITTRIKIVFSNSKFNDQLKIESSKILLRIIQVYNHILVNSENDTFSLLAFILAQLKKTVIVENKSNLILCLKELISNEHAFSSYRQVYDLSFEFVARNSNVKIQNYCILNIRKIIELFPGEIAADASCFQKLLGLLKTKIKEFDSDKLIKYAVTKCVQSLFELYPLSQDDTVFFLEMLSCKLKIEVQKLYIVEVMTKLKAGQCGPAKSKSKILESVLKQMADNLGSNNYELNAKTIQAVHNILTILGNNCTQKVVEELLEKSKLLLNDGKIPSYFSIIVDSRPKLLKPYAELIVKSTESSYISKLISNDVIDVNSCIKILKGIDLNEKGKKISLTLSSIRIKEEEIVGQIDESAWGRILIGALGYIGSEKTLGLLFNLIGSFKAEQSRFQAASAIGNIVSRNEAKLVPELVALGNKSKDVYIFIYIFKEMLNYNVKPFQYVTELIEWLLTKSENKFEAESNYYITSECVGKLAFISQEATQKVIASAQSDNQNRRLIVANSLRYGLQNHGNLESPSLPAYIQTIIQLLNDDKVRVREGAIKSLVNVGQLYIKGLTHYVHEGKFWKVLINNCTINNSLIVVIDYGICKEVRDEGKSLRLESLNLLQILVKKVQIDPHIIEELMAVVLNRLNEESSNDILLKRLSILKSLCELDYAHFIRLQEEFIRKIGFKEGIFKKYSAKAVEDERAEIYIKGVLKEVNEINLLAKEENIDTINTFLVQLRSNPTIGPLLATVEKAQK